MMYAAREAYKHFKIIGAGGSAIDWLRNKALPGILREGRTGEAGVSLKVPGVVLCEGDTGTIASSFSETFLREVSKHRAWDRDVSGIAA